LHQSFAARPVKERMIWHNSVHRCVVVQRFLVNTVVDQPTHPSLTVILNWTADLKK
jgi:hypothetical protein